MTSPFASNGTRETRKRSSKRHEREREKQDGRQRRWKLRFNWSRLKEREREDGRTDLACNFLVKLHLSRAALRRRDRRLNDRYVSPLGGTAATETIAVVSRNRRDRWDGGAEGWDAVLGFYGFKLAEGRAVLLRRLRTGCYCAPQLARARKPPGSLTSRMKSIAFAAPIRRRAICPQYGIAQAAPSKVSGTRGVPRGIRSAARAAELRDGGNRSLVARGFARHESTDDYIRIEFYWQSRIIRDWYRGHCESPPFYFARLPFYRFPFHRCIPSAHSLYLLDFFCISEMRESASFVRQYRRGAGRAGFSKRRRSHRAGAEHCWSWGVVVVRSARSTGSYSKRRQIYGFLSNRDSRRPEILMK